VKTRESEKPQDYAAGADNDEAAQLSEDTVDSNKPKQEGGKGKKED